MNDRPRISSRGPERFRLGVLASLRRVAPLLSILLGLVIVAQVTDLAPCADETEPHDVMHHEGEASAVAIAASGPHSVPVSDASDHRAADCLCHVAFTSTSVLPFIDVFDASLAAFDGYVASSPERSGSGTDHVPLG